VARPPAYKQSQRILRNYGVPYPEMLPEPARSQFHLTLAAEKAEREALNARLRTYLAEGRAAQRAAAARRIVERRRRLIEFLATAQSPISWNKVARALGCDKSTLSVDRKALGIDTRGGNPPICPCCGLPTVPATRGGDAPPEGAAGRTP
jgi:hypothetical protein